ncbi:MAG: hypothetical protein RBT65_11150 [Methanolobus sp.]|jgi:hypothetical protein|nr:hypothetical protein [Methanolobus sp.]
MFDAYWKVPVDPPHPNNDAVDFLFNAITPQVGSGIVQPVLEWNQLDSGRWTCRAWCVSGTDKFYSDPLYVSEGDEIQGLMSWNSWYNEWFICVTDTAANKQKYIYSDFVGDSNLEVYAALEGTYLQDNGDVPGDTTFYNMNLRDSNFNPAGDVTWVKWIDPSASNYLTGLDVDIISNPDKVKLHTAN